MTVNDSLEPAGSVVEIRRLKTDDWQTTRELRLAALFDAPEAFGGSYAMAAQRDEAAWRDWPSGGAVFAAFHDEKPVGMVAGCVPDLLDGEAELISMWVDPQARGMRIAARLIDAVADWAKARGGNRLYLEVRPDNVSARRSYERHGFVAAGSPVHDPEDIGMQLEL
jgi:ribosomal protein S18 acetylase RimI-like enzyme